MTTLTITIPDPDTPRVLTAFGMPHQGYVAPPRSPTDPPFTEEELRQELIAWVTAVTLAYERMVAANAAANAVQPVSVT